MAKNNVFDFCSFCAQIEDKTENRKLAKHPKVNMHICTICLREIATLMKIKLPTERVKTDVKPKKQGGLFPDSSA